MFANTSEVLPSDTWAQRYWNLQNVLLLEDGECWVERQIRVLDLDGAYSL